MVSSLYSYVVVYLAVLLVCASPITSTKLIDAICHNVSDGAFCVKILNAYPPVISATTAMQAAVASLNPGIAYAQKIADFSEKAGKDNPRLKKQFNISQDVYLKVVLRFKNLPFEFKDDPNGANYDAVICKDSTTYVKDLFGKNTDKASKTVVKMSSVMDNFIDIAVAAAVTVGG